MNPEATFIAAVCRAQDGALVFAQDIDRYFVSHRDIWNAVKDYYTDYKALPDVSVLQDKFRDFEVPDTTADPRFHLNELRNSYINGNLQNIVSTVAGRLSTGQGAGQELLDQLLLQASELSKETTSVKDIDITDLTQAEEDFKERAERLAKLGGVSGIPTGFAAIDKAYPTGMDAGHFIVLIGWSGRGKSWFASYMATKAWLAGYRPMFVSMEMSPDAMRDRIYTIMGMGEFKNSDLVRGQVDIDRFHKWGQLQLEGKQNFIIVSSEGTAEVSPLTIQSKIDQHKPDIVFVDYHQLMTDNAHSGQDVARNRNISRELKRLAMSNAIPVVDLSQTTQSDVSDTDNPPLIEQVAWSKGIQHDADLAIAVHKYPDTSLFDIICRKNRHGEEFAFGLDWNLNEGRITEVYDQD